MSRNTLMEVRPRVTQAVMPKTGTKMRICIEVLETYYPHPVSTGLVGKRVGITVSEASAFLSKLLDRGIVRKVTEGQGKEGGSDWRLSYQAEVQLNLRGN